MPDKHIKQINKKAPVQWGFIAGVAVFLGVAIYVVTIVMSGSDPRHRDTIATVTLLKPPPVPQVKEKPPEEIKQVEKKIEQTIDTPQDQPKGPENDNTPAGDKLGLDAEGTAGGDAFGLAGKKGGRSLLAGGNGLGEGSRFAGYSRIVETEIRKAVMKMLDENGGIPGGKLQSIVRLKVDSRGAVVDFKIVGSSGNNKMDEAVRKSLALFRISEPPPDGRPSIVTVKITSQS